MKEPIIKSKTVYKPLSGMITWKHKHGKTTEKERIAFRSKMDREMTRLKKLEPALAATVVAGGTFQGQCPFKTAYIKRVKTMAGHNAHLASHTLSDPGKEPKLELSISQHRNGTRHMLWLACRRFEDRYREHASLSEGERAKVEKIALLMADLLDNKSWNNQTEVFKQTISI